MDTPASDEEQAAAAPGLIRKAIRDRARKVKIKYKHTL